jgi:hypothetical protein
MDGESRMASEPGFDLVVLVRTVVVYNEVHVEVSRDVLVYPFEESEELLMPVSLFAVCNHLSGCHVQSAKKSGSAMPKVVMGDPVHVPEPQRQHRLATL